MAVFYRAFFCAALLLLICKIGSDLKASYNASTSQFALADWTDVPAEEEDSVESDDDATSEIAHVAVSRMLTKNLNERHSFDFNEFIEEIVPPPPQV